MGMYDTVRCDYPLTPELTGVECQSKDFDPYGGRMTDYYIDPDGTVWHIDYYGTTEYVRDPTGHKPWGYKRLPTGRRGRVKPHRITSYVSIYPVDFRGRWEDIPETIPTEESCNAAVRRLSQKGVTIISLFKTPTCLFLAAVTPMLKL